MYEVPMLGVGLGYRSELHRPILQHADAIDWLEVVTDQFIQTDPAASTKLARELHDRFPLVAHGLEMSIGSREPLDESYVSAVLEFAELVGARWFSDRLCFTREGGIELGQLTPVLRTHEAALEVARRAQQLQERAGRLFLMENITYYVDISGELSEAEFLSTVLQHCDSGLLLDLANLYINSVNHAFDPIEFLESIPLQRVVQVHLAGGEKSESVFVDSHSYRVHDEVWKLLRYLVERTSVKGVMIERDQDFPEDFGEILADLQIAREILRGHGQS